MSIEVTIDAHRRRDLAGRVPVAAVIAVGPDADLGPCIRGMMLAGVPRWVEVRGASSIADAYNVGQQAALPHADTVLYLHDDAELMVWNGAIEAAGSLIVLQRGLLGALGTRQRSRLPWWIDPSEIVGSCNQICNRPAAGPERVGLLDGVALMQRAPWQWDPLPGWHGYDTQRSLEAHDRGVPVLVHPGLACTHHSQGYKGREYHLAHVETCLLLAERWGLDCTMGGADLVL